MLSCSTICWRSTDRRRTTYAICYGASLLSWPIECGARKVPRLLRRTPFEASAASDAFFAKLQQLSPQNDSQRSLQPRAIQIATDIAQTRLLLFAQTYNSIPMPFLVVLIFWLTIIFGSFGLFAKPSATVFASLFVFALSAAGAIYLVLELGQPFAGLMQISSAPLRDALTPLSP
jgi:hypothetical protein